MRARSGSGAERGEAGGPQRLIRGDRHGNVGEVVRWPARHLREPFEPRDLLAQPPLSVPQPVRSVVLRVPQDDGDPAEREAQFAGAEELLTRGPPSGRTTGV
ncbi:hypothetical protein [Streptomyces sp. NPDC048521]|uniref:hypothetical protein n=1 Tax=Streptomyces sp. NPDC048521 TaxID=3365566 RepID=UPI0037131B55